MGDRKDLKEMTVVKKAKVTQREQGTNSELWGLIEKDRGEEEQEVKVLWGKKGGMAQRGFGVGVGRCSVFLHNKAHI